MRPVRRPCCISSSPRRSRVTADTVPTGFGAELLSGIGFVGGPGMPPRQAEEGLLARVEGRLVPRIWIGPSRTACGLLRVCP